MSQTFADLLEQVALGRLDVDPRDGVTELPTRPHHVVAGLALIESDAHPPVLRVALHRAGCPARFLADPDVAAATCLCGTGE